MANHAAHRTNKKKSIIAGGIIAGAALALIGAAPASADNKYNEYRDVTITFDTPRIAGTGKVIEANVLNDGHKSVPTPLSGKAPNVICGTTGGEANVTGSTVIVC